MASDAQTSAQNLQAAEQQIETDVARLGTVITAALADLKAEVTNALSAAGVPTSTVDSVTSKITALDQAVQALTTSTTAADPGPQG